MDGWKASGSTDQLTKLTSKKEKQEEEKKRLFGREAFNCKKNHHVLLHIYARIPAVSKFVPKE